MSWWCTFGLVSIEEQVWRTPQKSYLRPFSRRANLTHRAKSRRLQRVLTDFGSEHSFSRSVEHLREHYGIGLSATAVRDATLTHAKRARAMQQAKEQESFRILPRKGAEILIAQADGSMICTVEAGRDRDAMRPRTWKEMRLVGVQAHGSTAVHYGAGFSSVEETGRCWGHCAKDAGWGLSSRIHVVGDGAEWIWRQSVEVFGEQSSFLIDFYHLSEYLAAAAHQIAPTRIKQWLKTQQKRLKRGAKELVLATLEPFIEPADVAEEQAPVRSAWRYMQNRLECLDYAGALAKELPIGSGLIESGHKHVLQARLKQAGMAWLPESADAIAQLRVVRQNDQWDALWQHRQAA